MHKALYRKWRPKTFDEVCGQDHITSVLKYEIENSKFSHAYLFCGSRGTGKTTCAKILAKAVNCEHPVNGNPCGECEACRAIESGVATDVLEMDAASNNGVDAIRDIRDEVDYMPSMLKYKVYIVDEVHMLSTGAFNALLKTLEEPPAHVIFILATTELRKLPATIVSRCQHFEFRRIATDVLKKRLLYIAENEGIDLEPDAATILAKQALGGMRDAISLLELCSGTDGKITEESANESIGAQGREKTCELAVAIAKCDYDAIFASVDEAVKSAKDIIIFWQDLLSLYRDMLIMKTAKRPKEYLDLTDNEVELLSKISSLFSFETISYHCTILEDTLSMMMRMNSSRRITAEVALVKMCDKRLSQSPESVLARLADVEAKVNGINVNNQDLQMLLDGVKLKSDSDSSENQTAHDEKVQAIKEEEKEKETPAVTKVQEETKTDKLTSFRNRSEVTERLTQISPMTAPYFTASKWYTKNEREIIVKMRSKNEIDLVKMLGGDKEFLRALNETGSISRTLNDISFEVLSGDEEDDPLNDLIDNKTE